MNDDELIAWARANTFPLPNCRVNFEALWTSDVTELNRAFPRSIGGTYDGSSADYALAQFLAYLTQGDRDRVERLMWRSSLAREKWTDRRYMEAVLNMTCTRRGW